MGLYQATTRLQGAHVEFGLPDFPAEVSYGLFLRRQPDRGDPVLPLACPDLHGLCRHLHEARAGGGLQLLDSRFRFAFEPEPRDGVSIWTLDPDSGDRRVYLGWAWLNGAGRETLQAALQQQDPGPVQ